MPSPVTDPFFAIAGPTAGGKSHLALLVAERCGGEIVGADAFQIYAGLPTLTAQPSSDALRRVRHHLVGEVDSRQRFDVGQYLERARAAISEIRARGRVAIVCGGTGLYLRALLRGLADLPAADPVLRAELEAQPLPNLIQRLEKLDAVSAARLDSKNPRRVIRALEVCLLTGRPFSSFQQERPLPGGSRGIFLQRDRSELHSRIASRTAAMFPAVEEEVRAHGEAGETASLAIGWREVRQLLAREIDRAECERRIAEATRQYAKRQETWFRKESALVPTPVTGEDLDPLAEQLATAARRHQAGA